MKRFLLFLAVAALAPPIFVGPATPAPAVVINVTDFGAKCDGSTDDTAAIRAWAAAAGTGYHLIIPPNTCVFKSPITFPIVDNVYIDGAGRGGTLLYAGTATTGNVITIGSTVNGCSVSGWTIQNVRFTSATTMKSGDGLRLNDMCDTRIQNLTLGGEFGAGSSTNWWNALHVNGGNSIQIDGLWDKAINRGLLVNGDAGAGGPQLTELMLNRCKIDGVQNSSGSGVGIEFGGNVGGAYADDCDILENNEDVLISQTQTPGYGNNQFRFGKSFAIDLTAPYSSGSTATGIGLEISDPGGPQFSIEMSGSWVASAAKQGIKIDSTVTTLAFQFDGGDILNNNNFGNAVAMVDNESTAAGVNIQFVGTRFWDCCSSNSVSAIYNVSGAQPIAVLGGQVYNSMGSNRVRGSWLGYWTDGADLFEQAYGSDVISAGPSSFLVAGAGATSSYCGLWVGAGVVYPGKMDASSAGCTMTIGSAAYPFSNIVTTNVVTTTEQVIDTSTSDIQALLLSAANDTSGVNLRMTGNGSTTPSKYLRVFNGYFQIVSSNYMMTILNLSDAGVLSAPAFSAGGAPGVSCSGAPTSSFATVKGLVTHC